MSNGLNLSRGSNMVGFTLNCIQFLKIQAGAQLKPVFGRFNPRLEFIKFGHWAFLFAVSMQERLAHFFLKRSKREFIWTKHFSTRKNDDIFHIFFHGWKSDMVCMEGTLETSLTVPLKHECEDVSIIFISILRIRVVILRLRYSGCAPMFGKCRLNRDNPHMT